MAITAHHNSTASHPRRRGARALLTSVGVSQLGDGAFAAALPLATAAITRNPVAVSIVSVAELAPLLVLTPVAGALIDRWPARRVLVVCDLLRAVVIGVLAVLVATGTASIAALAIGAATAMGGAVFVDIASQAIVPQLTVADDLARVNGRIGAMTTAGREMAGPPLGSTTYAVLPGLPFLIDAVSFVASAVVLRVALPAAPAADQTRGNVLASIGAGIRYLVHHRTLRAMCLVIGAGNISYSMVTAILVLYARAVLHVSTWAYGLLLATMAIGGVLGGVLAGHIVKKIGTLPTVILGNLAQAAAWITIAWTGNVWAAGAGLAAASWCSTIATTAAITARQLQTPPEMLARVTSAFRTVGAAALPAGAALGGVIASVWGLSAPIWVAGGFLALFIGLTGRSLFGR